MQPVASGQLALELQAVLAAGIQAGALAWALAVLEPEVGMWQQLQQASKLPSSAE